MIRLSRLTDYAVTLLSHMGSGKEGDLWAASGLADTTGLPMPTVAKILKLMAKSGVIQAQRGATGGYRLARSTSEISVAEIIEAMDGPISLTDCADSNPHEGCQLDGVCPMSNGWKKVNVAVRRALTSVSLAEMCLTPLPVIESGATHAEGP